MKLTLPRLESCDPVCDGSLRLATHRTLQTVGLHFEAWWREHHGVVPDEVKEKTESQSPGSSPTTDGKNRRFDKKVVKMTEEETKIDWYEVLQLEQQESATPEEIKIAFRKRCLETHPDKQPGNSDEEFKKVTRASEILSDPEMKRAFDSSRPFDDTIPNDGEYPADKFYSTFNPVFVRNSKWSVSADVPSIGDDSTPIPEVKKFYEFWTNFRTWRDFSHEIDVEGLDDGWREERRAAQREAQKEADRLRRQELKRIRALAENAQRNDPRLRRKREEEAAAKLRIKEEKEAAELKKIQEQLRRREAEEQAIIDAEAKKKQERLDFKKRSQDAYTRARDHLIELDLFDDTPSKKLMPDTIREINLQWIFSKVKTLEETTATSESILKLTAEPEGDGISGALAFNKMVQEREFEIGNNRFGEPVKRPKVVAPAPVVEAPKKVVHKDPTAATWAQLDLDNLHKAIAKFPGGTVDRWRRIQTALLPSKFTEEEILVKVKEVEASWKSDKTVMKQRMPTLPSADSGASGDAPKSYDRVGVEPAEIKDPAADEWTPNQQKLLEATLRELRDYKEKDRWQKLADGVPGKTPKQCQARFKYLCQIHKAKQAAK